MSDSLLFFKEHETYGHNTEKCGDRDDGVKRILQPGQHDGDAH